MRTLVLELVRRVVLILVVLVVKGLVEVDVQETVVPNVPPCVVEPALITVP